MRLRGSALVVGCLLLVVACSQREQSRDESEPDAPTPSVADTTVGDTVMVRDTAGP